MDDIRFTVHTVPSDSEMGAELFIQHNGAWIQKFECIEVAKEEEPPVALQLENHQVQDLMNKLWIAGFRPT